MVILALVLGRPLPKQPRVWGILTIVGFGATSLGFLGMFHAAEFVSPGIATVIASTQPLMAAGLAAIVLNERLTWGGKLGLAVGLVGIIVLASPQLFSGDQQSYITGIAYIVMAAVGITVSNVMIKKIAGSVDVLMAMGFQMLIGSIPLVLAAVVTEQPATVHWTITFVTALVLLSLFGSALAYWLWFSALETVPLNRANAFSFLTPVVGLALGMLFYGETIGWLQMIGIALAILGVGLVTRGIEGKQK